MYSQPREHRHLRHGSSRHPTRGGEFPGIFVRQSSATLNRPRSRVETLLDYRYVRSRCHDGTRAALSTCHARPLREEPDPMMKNALPLLVTAMTSLLAGCSLYFG